MYRQFRTLEKGEQIVVAADTATGMGDYCAAQFVSKKHIDVPLVYHSRILATEMTNSLYPVLEKIFDVTEIKPTIGYERNNGGLFEMERLASLNRNHKFEIFQMPTYGVTDTETTTKLGWDTNTATRPKMLSELKEAVDKRVLRIYDKATIDELLSFVVVESSMSRKAQAEKGGFDDLVMSLAIAWQLYQMVDVPVTAAVKDKMLKDFPEENLFDKEGFY